jgi:hypothetical protein
MLVQNDDAIATLAATRLPHAKHMAVTRRIITGTYIR